MCLSPLWGRRRQWRATLNSRKSQKDEQESGSFCIHLALGVMGFFHEMERGHGQCIHQWKWGAPGGMHPAIPRRCLTSQERLCSGTQEKMIFLSVSARTERVTSQSVSSLLLKTHSKCLANWLSSRKWWTKPMAKKNQELSQTGQRLMENSKGRVCENFGVFLMFCFF